MSQVRRSEQASRRLPAALGGVRFSDGFGQVQGEAWNAVSTLLSGIFTFGAIGLGLDHLFGTGPVLLVVGILCGKALGVYVIYARHFTRKDEVKPVVPAVAGWSKSTPVAGSGQQAHPKADLSAWPYSREAHHAS